MMMIIKKTEMKIYWRNKRRGGKIIGKKEKDSSHEDKVESRQKGYQIGRSEGMRKIEILKYKARIIVQGGGARYVCAIQSPSLKSKS